MLRAKTQNLQQTVLLVTCQRLKHGMEEFCTAFPSTTREKEPRCYSCCTWSFCRSQEGPDTCRLVPQQMPRLRCGTEPLGQGELPAPSSGDELLGTREGRAGDDTTALQAFPAGRLLLRLRTLLPGRASDAGPRRFGSQRLPSVPGTGTQHEQDETQAGAFNALPSHPNSSPPRGGQTPFHLKCRLLVNSPAEQKPY